MVNNILIADLIFLVVFTLFVVIFLVKNKKNLKREGIIYLYRTAWGMKAIEDFSKKHTKFIHRIKYLVIVVAFLLMVSIVLMLALNAFAYLNSPEQTIEATDGAPPLALLVPYFPQIFGMESFFPNFYFSYFIIALAIVAIAHEFSHGVFMKAFGVKIKSTGFLFLGPILGAFVEENKDNLLKKKNSEQMAILGAGVFANFVLAIGFFLVLVAFFNLSYSPSGYVFSDYAQTIINSSSIIGFENYSDQIVSVNTSNQSYFISHNLYSLLESNKTLLENTVIIVYLDSPAIRNELRGAVTELDGIKITGWENFQEEMLKKSAGQNISLNTLYRDEILQFNLTLDESPLNYSRGFLGVGHLGEVSGRTTIRSVLIKIINFKEPTTYYSAKYNKDIAEFIYYLIWWIALINLFVGLFNMLPVGILDGGRFTYLFILSFVKSEKKSERIYKIISSTIGVIFLLILFGWLFAKFLK